MLSDVEAVWPTAFYLCCGTCVEGLNWASFIKLCS
jgi:hypothetical protein